MFFIIVTIFCVIPLYLTWISLKWSEADKKLKLPGPKWYPIIGSLAELWDYVKTNKVYEKILEYADTYGDTFRVRVGPKLLIFTRDLKILEKIMNDPKFIRGHEYKTIEAISGDSLLTTSGERWFKLRKLITPAFHFSILERHVHIFEEHSDVMIELLKEKEGQAFNMLPYLYNLAFDTIGETSMGVNFNAQTTGHHDILEAYEWMAKLFTVRLNNGFLTNEFIFHLTPLYQKQKKYMKIINDFVNNVIEKRRNELINENDKNKNIDNIESYDKKRPNLIEILLNSTLDGKPLTNDDIRNEVKTFILAGHETTSNALGIILYICARYPEVQDKIVDEINDLIDVNEPLSIKKLNSLAYLDCVIKESLRLYPAGTMLPKRCLEDYRDGDFFLPADTTVMILIYGTHMDEKNFKNCRKFDPDRWNEEVTVQDRNPYANLPFSAGMRNCIGQRFALLEMKTVLVKILSQFKIELGEKDFVPNIIECGSMKSKNGYLFKLKSR